MNQDRSDVDVAASSLVASGFPFQTAIASLVRKTNNWTLEREEFPWRDTGGEDRFLDIVARRGRFVVAIECKKTNKDILTFLQPDGRYDEIVRSRCLFLSQIRDSTLRMELFCGDWMIRPPSVESMFCVVSTSGSGRDQRLLERDAQLLIGGADAYGRHFHSEFVVRGPQELDHVIVPAIVTNAELFVAEYFSWEVLLDTGELSLPLRVAPQPVPWVRFRKAFSGSKDGDRTVYVVRASELQRWLTELDFDGVVAVAEVGKSRFK